MFRVKKTYGHELGLSACFRQWRAESHCRYLHGYALSFSFTFEASDLDTRNWVLDFGNLKPLKEELVQMFDHKLIIADDDPWKDELAQVAGLGLAEVVVAEGPVGCEAFAFYAFQMAELFLGLNGYAPRVRIVSVECAEHGANSAIYSPHGF